MLKVNSVNVKSVQNQIVDVADISVSRLYSQNSSAARSRLYRARKKHKTKKNSQGVVNKSYVKSYSSTYEAVRKRIFRAQKKLNSGTTDEKQDTIETTNTANIYLASIGRTNCLNLPYITLPTNPRKRSHKTELVSNKRRCYHTSGQKEVRSKTFVKYMENTFFKDTLDEYCRVCDRIWWLSRLKVIGGSSQQAKYLNEHGYNVSQETKFYVCSNCWTFLRMHKMPTMATVHGFVYPKIPEHLPPLCPISERLICPRLPFMQIRKLNYFAGSKRLQGQVINVPVDVNNMVCTLPRSLDDDFVFNVNIKRHLLHKSNYMSGCISKTAIKEWLSYLIETPLYQAYNVKINQNFFKNIIDENFSNTSNRDISQVHKRSSYEHYNEYNSISSTPVSTNSNFEGSRRSLSRYHLEDVEFPTSSPAYTECLYDDCNYPLSPPVYTDNSTESSEYSDFFDNFECPSSSPIYTDDSSEANEDTHFSNFTNIDQRQRQFHKQNELEDPVYNKKIMESYKRMHATLTEKCSVIPGVQERIATSEQLLSGMQQTLFWSEEAILNLAPGQNSQPLALAFDGDAEELSFPSIYFGHQRKFTVKVTSYAMATSEIRRRNRRGIRSDHLLYMAAKILRLRVLKSFQVMFHAKGNTVDNITRSNIEDREFIRETMLRNESFLKQIPNSVQYWYSRKRDLFAMMRQLGKPTLFLTLSASEVHWKPLMKYVYKFNQSRSDDGDPIDLLTDEAIDSMSASARAELINSDPAICCLYFNKLVDAIMASLKMKSGPFGQYRVVDFFRRIEFQHRGSAHCHALLWLDNAPDESVSENMPQTVQLINELCSVDKEEVKSSRSLQTHNHTHTCYKRTKVCRFGAPFWPMNKTTILLPVPANQVQDTHIQRYRALHQALEHSSEFTNLEDFLAANFVSGFEDYLQIIRHGIHRPTVFMKRDLKNIWTSPFNPIISPILQSNMDIQFILDEYSCAAYVAEYVNKSQRGFSSLHRELIALRDEFPDMDYDSCLKELGRRTLNNIEMCAQEAAWFLLRLPMSESSRVITYVPTQHPSERFLSRKSHKQMNEEGLLDDSTDIWKQNIIQIYEQRPDDLNSVCLANFIANYDLKRRNAKDNNLQENDVADNCECTTIPHNSTDTFLDDNSAGNDREHDILLSSAWKTKFRKRSKSKILRYKSYKASDDILNYKREMVTLFWPFRNEELEILNNDAYVGIFDSNEDLLLQTRKPYDCGLELDSIEKLANSKFDESKENGSLDTDIFVGPILKDIPTDYIRANGKQLFQPNDDDITTCQRNVSVKKIDKRLSHENFCVLLRTLNVGQKSFILEFIRRLLYAKDDKLMQVFLTGPAGSGKSYVLRCLMETANRFTVRQDMNKCAYVACATTGKAAVNIDGTTIHTAFNIGINSKRRLPLQDFRLQSMRCDFADVATIILDEVSMMGAELLNVVAERLRCIGSKPCDNLGGFHTIFTGDLRQLPPVNARAVYTRPPNILQDCMVWQNLEYYELTEVVRQSDKTFSDILTKIGNGDKLLDEERNLIESRFFDTIDLDSRPELENAVRLFHRNKDVDNYNNHVLLKCSSYSAVAIDVIRGHKTEEQLNSAVRKINMLDVTSTGNMPAMLHLVLDKPYVVTQNIDKIDNIVNGSFGYLRFIEFATDTEAMMASSNFHQEIISNTENNDDLTTGSLLEFSQPHSQIIRLWLEFSDTSTGQLLRAKYRQHTIALGIPTSLTPVVRREAIFNVGGSKLIKAKRKQFPLIPANAMTIHKSQGATYDSVVYEYDRLHALSLVYVAMSRAKSLHGLYLTNHKHDFNFHHCKQNSNERLALQTEFERLRTKRLKTVVQDCIATIRSSYENIHSQIKSHDIPQSDFTLLYLNCQSLKAHQEDLNMDPVVRTRPGILALTETWIHDKKQFNTEIVLTDYKCVSHFNSGRSRAGGVAIYQSLKSSHFFSSCQEIKVDNSNPLYGDVCCVHLKYYDRYGNNKEIYIITMYAQPNISSDNLILLLDTFLTKFQNIASANTNRKSISASTPVLICGDFNHDFSKSLQIPQYLRDTYNLEWASKHIITTRHGTSIDAVFYKGANVEVIPYISYFSLHRPLLVSI